MSKREGGSTKKSEQEHRKLILGESETVSESPSLQPDRPPATDLPSLLQSHLANISPPPPVSAEQNARLGRKISPCNTFVDNGGYLPALGSPGPGDGVDEGDTLDASMNELEKDAVIKGVPNTAPGGTQEQQKFQEAKDVVASGSSLPGVFKVKEHAAQFKAGRDDIIEEFEEESYYKWLEETPNAGKAMDVDDELDALDYDADSNPIAPEKNKDIDPLPAIDHSQIAYQTFARNFYEEHPDTVGLFKIQVIDLQQKLNVKVSGPSPPNPVSSFAHFGFDESLLKSIRKSEFSSPTSIQAMGIPAVLGGRDVLVIAQTGSGNTSSFIWPMLVHIMDQRELASGEGPIALVLVPTRELAMEIFSEARKYCKVYNIHVVCAYGGGNKYEQSKAFEQGAKIAIATPGSMIDLIKMNVTNLERVTYLVLDEADKMLDTGVEDQVRSLCDHVRPDRQTQLYSATFKMMIEKLARDVLTDPVKLMQGDVGVALENVTQIVTVVPLGEYKWQWLTKSLVQFMIEGLVLVFVTKKQNCEELAYNLKVKAEIDCRCLHGDICQNERDEIISAFKKQEFPVLVATDVAAKGLDLPHIKNVVNFDVASDIDTHTHRVARTSRVVSGNAHTLVTVNDKEYAGHLVRNLESTGQSVSKELYDLAMQSSWFKNSRFKSGRGKGAGGAGLGYKEIPDKDDTPNCEQVEFDKKHKQGIAVLMPKPGTDRLEEDEEYNLNSRIIDAEYDDMNTGGMEAEEGGNATGPVTPSQYICSPDVYSPPVLSDDPRTSPWELRSGTMGTRQDIVSIFTCNTEHGASECDLDTARSAVMRMRDLKHPALLKPLQILQTESSLIIVTEKVSPLKQYLTKSIEQVDHSLGLLQVCSLFSFLHYEAKLKHNNINLNSVFVASNGDWKLGGFEFSVGVDEEESQLHHHRTPPQKYKPPDGKVPTGVPAWSDDTWSFGCLLWEIFNLESDDLNLAFINNIPQNMHTVFKQCLARNPMKRPSPKKLEELLMSSPEARITTSPVLTSQPDDVRFCSTNDDVIKDRLGPIGGSTSADLGLRKHGYSTMSSITESSLSSSQNGVSIKRARTENVYFNSDDEKEAAPEDTGGYQPAHGSSGPGDGVDVDETLDSYMNELEKEAVTKGVTNTAPGVILEEQLRGVQKAKDVGASGSGHAEQLAIQSSWFKSGSGKGVGGAGLGYKERPALGSRGGSSSNNDDTLNCEQFQFDKKHKQGLAVPVPMPKPGTDRLVAGFKAASTEEGEYNLNARIIGTEYDDMNTSGREAIEDGNATDRDLAETGFSLTDTSKDLDQSKKLGQLKQYVCPVCGKSYVQRQSLKRHTQRAHKCPLVKLLPKKKFKCTLCIKSFSFVQGLNRHIKGDHSDSEGQIAVVQNANITSNPASKPTLCPYEQIREDNIREKIMVFNSLKIAEDVEFLKNCD